MLNSAACRSKTTRAPAGAPRCGNSSRDKGLMQGRSLRYRRAFEISRNIELASNHMSYKKEVGLLMASSEDCDTEGTTLEEAGGGGRTVNSPLMPETIAGLE